jgi:hypothetical protein
MFRPGKFGIPELVGAMVYTRPTSPTAAAKYHPSNPDKCLELRRLCCIDDTPRNAESFFIGRTLKWLRKNTEIEFIISYADPEFGHAGTIYKASNFKLYGMTNESSQLEVDGRRYHTRTLSKFDRPYGRKIHDRYVNGDPGIKLIKTKPKYIYVYSLV